jgi:hypothetical protein
MGLVWGKKTVCPVCRQHFEAYNVHLNKISLSKLEPDLFPVYSKINPLFFSLHTCPKCKYTAFPDDFEKFRDFKSETKFKIREVLKKFENTKIDLSKDRTLKDAIKIHSIAFLIYGSYTKDILILAELSLKLGWLNKLNGDKEKEVYFKLQTIKYLEEAFDKGKTSPKFSEIKMMYLIGEINYEFERYDKAKQWLGRLVEYSYRSGKNPLIPMAKSILEEMKK